MRLSTEQLKELASKVTYKPGWEFDIYEGKWEGQHIAIKTQVPDAYDVTKMVVLDVHSMLPFFDAEDQFYQWLLWRITRIEVHEAREFFRVNGKVFDDPHAELAGRDL